VPLLDLWRRSDSFRRGAFAANLALIVAGFLLTSSQIKGYLA